MAKYISDTTSSVRNKLGGVVFSQGRTARTFRSMSVPRRSSGPSPQAQNLIALQATNERNLMEGLMATQWQLFTSWWYANRSGGQPVWHASNTLYLQSFQNAALLGVDMPGPGAETNPRPPQAPLAAVLTTIDGVLSVDVFPTDGQPMGTPWLCFVTYLPNGRWQAIPNDGGTYMCGSLDGEPVPISDAMMAAWGQLLPYGGWVGLRIVTLWPNWNASYAQCTSAAQYV